MKQFTFSLHLTYQQFQSYYLGNVANVMVTTDTGLRLQLPAMRLRPFLSHSGIHGRFRLSVDDANKFIRLEQIAFF